MNEDQSNSGRSDPRTVKSSTPDFQKHPLVFLREQLLSWKSITTYLTSLSLFGVVHDGLKFGLSIFFERALDYYERFLALAFRPVEALISLSFQLLRFLFDWNFHLVGEWRHAFLIMGLYFAVDLRVSYIVRQLKPRRAIVGSTAMFALIVACGFSAFGGWLGERFGPLWAILMPVIGFGVYELLKAPISATYIRIPSYSWFQTFAYYGLLYGIANLVLGGLATLTYLFSPAWSAIAGAEVLVLVLFLFLLAMRNVVVAWVKTVLVPSNLSGSRFMIFLTSGSVRIAINVLYALLLLLTYVAINAYLSNQGM